jgi:hypothetical protein
MVVIASEAWQSHKKESFINIIKRLPRHYAPRNDTKKIIKFE